MKGCSSAGFQDGRGWLSFPGSLDKRKELLANMEVILRCKDLHWSQKVKCKWKGDGNTKFFHRLANGEKKMKNSISKLNIEGEMVNDFEKIKEVTIHFDARLYTKERGDRTLINNLFDHSLDMMDAEDLESTLSLEEIKETVFDMAKDKSPSPNGFSMLSYQVCWDFIKEDLLKVFN